MIGKDEKDLDGYSCPKICLVGIIYSRADNTHEESHLSATELLLDKTHSFENSAAFKGLAGISHILHQSNSD